MKYLKLRKLKNWSVLCLMIFVSNTSMPISAFAQEADLGNWYGYFGSKKIQERWNWHHEVQYRNYNLVGDLEQLLLRTGIGYNLTPGNNNALAGYGYILSENYLTNSDEKVEVHEHRIFQQFINKHRLKSGYVQHRFRLEERFIEDNFKMRFRYFIAYRLGLTDKEIKDNTLYASFYNELFLNFDTPAFDRNRLYGGLGYQLSKNVRFELGYMNQFFDGANRDQVNILAFVNF